MGRGTGATRLFRARTVLTQTKENDQSQGDSVCQVFLNPTR